MALSSLSFVVAGDAKRVAVTKYRESWPYQSLPFQKIVVVDGQAIERYESVCQVSATPEPSSAAHYAVSVSGSVCISGRDSQFAPNRLCTLRQILLDQPKSVESTLPSMPAAWEAARMRKKNKKPVRRKIVLRLPDLDHAKNSVLNSLSSPKSRRNYRFAMEQFITWYCFEPRLALNRAVV